MVTLGMFWLDSKPIKLKSLKSWAPRPERRHSQGYPPHIDCIGQSLFSAETWRLLVFCDALILLLQLQSRRRSDLEEVDQVS